MSLIMFSSSGVLDPLKWEPPARYQYPTMCTRSVNSVLHTTVQDTAVLAVLHTYAHLNLDTFTCTSATASGHMDMCNCTPLPAQMEACSTTHQHLHT